MPIEVIEPLRLYRQIGDQLRNLIMVGEFEVGARLPPERDLARQLGVSRPSLREALIALEVEGHIEIRKGSGIYVSHPKPAADTGFDLSNEEGPLELIRARSLLEGEIAATAAKTGNKMQFDAIEDALHMMEAAARTGVSPLKPDGLFHVRVAEATNNSVLVGIVKRLFDARMGPLFTQLHGHFDSPKLWAQAISEHWEVLKALRSKNPVRARAAMRRHMEMTHKRLTATLTRASKPSGTSSRASSAVAVTQKNNR